MHTLTVKFIVVILLAVALAGCARAPYLDQHFGDAVSAAMAQQTINPKGAPPADPALGIDGQAANGAIDNYHKSFEQSPTTTNIFNIGVGAGGSAGAPAR